MCRRNIGMFKHAERENDAERKKKEIEKKCNEYKRR